MENKKHTPTPLRKLHSHFSGKEKWGIEGWFENENERDNCFRAVNYFDGMKTIIDVRMEALKEAIIKKDWADVEFQFDRVERAMTKAIDQTERK